MRLWFLNKGQKLGGVLANLQKNAKFEAPKMPNIPKNFGLKIPENIDTKSITDFLQNMIKDISKMPSAPSGPSRPMKFPYTLSAKIAQFPFKYYYKNNWIFQWYPFGVAACVPLFWYIGRKVNSKENKAKWKEIRRKEREEAHHKFDYK